MVTNTPNSTPEINSVPLGSMGNVFSTQNQMEQAIHALDEARKGEERLRLAMDCGQLATWDWDVVTGQVLWSDRHYLMQGYEIGEVEPSYATWLARVHPEDRLAANELILKARESKIPYRHEFRSMRPDGTIRWLSAQGQFLYDDSGEPVRMIGVARDITTKRLAEEALKDNEEKQTFLLKLADALRSLDDPVEIQGTASRLIGGYFRADRVGYAETFVGDETRVVIIRDWHREGVVTSVGRYLLSDFGSFIPEFFLAGHDLIIDDTFTDSRLRPIERVNWETLGVRAVVCRPLLKMGRLAGCMFIHCGHPRKWSLHEIGLLHDLAERTWVAVERAKAELALREARDHLEEKVAQRTLQLEEALERRAELNRQLARVQEEERRRVSRELHDSVGQLLAGLSLALKAVETSSPLPSSTTAKLSEAQKILETLGQEVHTLATRLRPTALDDLGLEVALGQLIGEWSSQNGIRADFHVSGLGANRLPNQTETTTYRIVQEALNNVARHAKASAVSVVVNHASGVLTTVIEDNGIGFELGGIPKGRLGLVGMRERATLVGGDLDIETRPEAGTTIFIRLPVPE